jgi:hypothetical protein
MNLRNPRENILAKDARASLALTRGQATSSRKSS